MLKAVSFTSDNNHWFRFFICFLNVKYTYEKVLLRNYIKMTKMVSPIFSEGKQIKAFKVFDSVTDKILS